MGPWGVVSSNEVVVGWFSLLAVWFNGIVTWLGLGKLAWTLCLDCILDSKSCWVHWVVVTSSIGSGLIVSEWGSSLLSVGLWVLAVWLIVWADSLSLEKSLCWCSSSSSSVDSSRTLWVVVGSFTSIGSGLVVLEWGSSRLSVWLWVLAVWFVVWANSLVLDGREVADVVLSNMLGIDKSKKGSNGEGVLHF
jgi:hypothetical protein